MENARVIGKKSGVVVALILAAVMSVSTQKSTDRQRIEGQVVCCLDCWAEKDRLKEEYGTAEDLLTAKGCVEGGDPTLLAVREGDRFSFYQLEEGSFKLDAGNWLGYVGKKVLITGWVREQKKVRILTVDELVVTEESLAGREAKKVLGTSVGLELKDLYGAKQSLGSFQGRIVILNFWATYCPPCIKEMPDLAEIQNEFAAFGVQVIGANSDPAEDRPKVLKFIREAKVNFPVWMGSGASDTMRFGLGEALPGTVIIDRDGKIARVISGVIDKDDIRKQIKTMLNGSEGLANQSAPPEGRKEPAPEKADVSSVPS